jgi:hypothetical protein
MMQKLSCKKTCINKDNFLKEQQKQQKQTTNKDEKKTQNENNKLTSNKNGGNCHHEKLQTYKI